MCPTTRIIGGILVVFYILIEVHGQSPAPCLYNSTHCSCSVVPEPGPCLQTISENTCLVGLCKSPGKTCDCSGTTLCRIERCAHNVASDGSLLSALQINSTVACVMSQNLQCLKRVGELPVENLPPQVTEYRQLQFGPPSISHMYNLSAFVDTENVISMNNSMHGIWPSYLRLKNRFIHIRVYENQARNETYLCAIYNAYHLPSDGKRSESLDVQIEGLAGQNLAWAACDDLGECRGGPSSTLTATHSFDDNVTDGWCISPLEYNGNAVRVTFSNVEAMLGIELQSSGSQYEYLWGEPLQHGMTGTVDSDGLSVAGGASFVVSLGGIPVPDSGN